MSTISNKENSMRWLCESMTSKRYGFKPFKTSMKKECFVCGFKDYLRVHHIIPLAKIGNFKSVTCAISLTGPLTNPPLNPNP